MQGGTNQQKGLETGATLFEKNNKKKTAILITDGAPNQTGVNWTDSILAAATDLKNKYGEGSIDLYTLGLSLSMVGEENRKGMKNIATGPGYSYSAETGMDVLSAMERIIEAIIDQASLKGTVTDTIDGAFYPVTRDGVRLEAGDVINLQGEKTTDQTQPYGTVQYDAATDTYSVVWSGQTIPYSDSGEKWSGTVYVKAKEDFLGGNTIKTNGGQNDNFTATHYLVNNNEYPVESGKTITAAFDTPYVNVDELSLNQNATEWTVYLGTEVDPVDTLKEFFRQIKVSEVVSRENDDHRRNTNSTKITDNGFEAKTFPLTDITGTLSDEQWNTLIGGGTVTIPYTGYNGSRYGNDDMGSIVITLTKEGTGSAYENHKTTVTGEPAETYTLKVEYQPSEVNTTPDYHTTTGGSPGDATGRMTSTNIHKIDVFAKSFRITKTDETYSKTLSGAEFKLYRTSRTGETADLITIDGQSYSPVALLDLSGGVAIQAPVERLEENERYYLIETKAPAGYNLMTSPIEVRLSIADSYTPLPGSTSQSEKPQSGLYDWTETALLQFIGSGFRRTNADGSGDMTHAGAQSDSITETLYFNIMNTSGYELPQTGGIGTTLFTILGSILVLGAGFLLWRRREPGKYSS